MDLLEKLKEIIGDDDKASLVQSALGEFMIPKSEYAKLRDKNKDLETQFEQTKLSAMTEQEKFQHELEKTKALQRDLNIKLNRAEAESVFIASGLTKEEYGELLEKSVSEDKEATLALVSGFANVLTKTKETVANKTKEDLMKIQTPPSGDPVPPTPNKKIKTSF